MPSSRDVAIEIVTQQQRYLEGIVRRLFAFNSNTLHDHFCSAGVLQNHKKSVVQSCFAQHAYKMHQAGLYLPSRNPSEASQYSRHAGLHAGGPCQQW